MRNCVLILGLIASTLAATAQKPELIATSTYNGGSIFTITTDGVDLKTIQTFAHDGSDLRNKLTPAPDGFLYGVAFAGGDYVMGLVFKVRPDGTGFTKVYQFKGVDGNGPQGAVIVANDGALYGTTVFGGDYNAGVLFKISQDGSYVKLHDFTANAFPIGTLFQARDGRLYGTALNGGTFLQGSLYSIDLDGSNYSVYYSFNNIDGYSPYSSVVEDDDGNFYTGVWAGGSNGLGTILKISPDHSGTPIYQFSGPDGANPGELMVGADGYLYGTTWYGGVENKGAIFKVTKNGTGFTKLHDFTGVTGAGPRGSLIQDGTGELYGTATTLGASNGILFKIKPDGSGFTVMRTYLNALGTYPNTPVLLNGNLYGTTSGSRLVDAGTVFKYDLTNQSYQTLFVFQKPDGDYPNGEIIKGTDGNLYGMVSDGTSANGGAIFTVRSGQYSILHKFGGDDGFHARGALTSDGAGNLFGMAYSGGGYLGGTIFKIKEDGTGFTKLHDLSSSDGVNPNGSLLRLPSGDLFGMTDIGGANGMGTVFRLHDDGTGFTVLMDFSGPDGSHPKGSLIAGQDGFLYGLTNNGGSNDTGIIFKIMPDGTSFSKIHDFDATISNPVGNLLELSSGELVGVANGGIFKIEKDGTNFTVLKQIDVMTANLIQLPDGFLYGIRPHDGVYTVGRLFKIKPDGTQYTNLRDLTATNGLSVSSLLSVGLSQTILFGSLPSKNVGDAAFALTASATSGLPINYSTSNPAVATIVGNVVTIVGAGTSEIKATQDGDATYNFAMPVIQTLTVNILQPTITSFTPQAGVIGSSVVITGTNFSSVPANNIVKFHGTAAVVTSSSTTSLTVIVPPLATSGKITISTGSQTAESAGVFNVLTPPSITSISPKKGFVGTHVTILGTFFDTSPTNNLVRFNGVSGIVSASTSTSIVVDVPQTAMTGPVTVTVNGLTVTSSENFTVMAPPLINNVSPVSGTVGTVVTLTGSNFDPVPSLNVVDFNGKVATVVSGTTTTLTTSVPAGASTGAIHVAVNGRQATSPEDFTIAIVTGDVYSFATDVGLVLYPNPAKTELIVRMDNLKKGETLDISVYDQLGRQIETKSGSAGENLLLDLRQYQAGRYLVRAVCQTGTYSKVFVKH